MDTNKDKPVRSKAKTKGNILMGAKKTDSQELIRRQLGYVLLKSKRKDSEILEVYISSVQSLSRVRLFATP